LREWAAEAQHLRLLTGKCRFYRARQIYADPVGDFIATIAVPIINIHHCFLPAFIGNHTIVFA